LYPYGSSDPCELSGASPASSSGSSWIWGWIPSLGLIVLTDLPTDGDFDEEDPSKELLGFAGDELVV
jgi:hypothetical protein